MNDGNVLISVDADTREVVKTLSDLKSKVKQIFKGADTTDLKAAMNNINAEIKRTEAEAKKAQTALDKLAAGDKDPQAVKAINAELKSSESQIAKLQAALDALITGEKSPQSVKILEEQLQAAESELAAFKEQYETLLQGKTGTQVRIQTLLEKGDAAGAQRVLDSYNASMETAINNYNTAVDKVNTLYTQLESLRQNPALTPEAQEYQAQIDAINSKATELRGNIQTIRQNPELTAEGQRYTQTIKEATERVEELKQKQAQLSNEIEITGKMGGITNNSLVRGLDKVGNRLLRLAKRVFFFSLFTKMLRGLRSALGSLIKSDEAFAISLAQIKGNLATAFGAIWSSVLPALRVLVYWLAKATQFIAQFILWLTGKKFSEAQSAVQGISQGTADIGSAAKDATKQLNRMLLPFDEMNVLSSQDGGGGGGGGGAGGGGIPSTIWPDEMEGLTAKFEKFKDLIVLIGMAFASWKLAKVLMPLLQMLGWGGSLLTLFGGILSIAFGIYEIVQAIRSIKEEGPNFANVMQLISGALLVVGGALALISGPIGWIIVAMGAVAGAFSWLYKNSLVFRDIIDSIWKRLKEYKDRIVKAFKEGGFKKVFKELLGVGWEIIKSILGGISIAKQVIHDWLQEHVFEPIRSAIGGWISNTDFAIKIRTVFTDTKAKLTKTWNKLTGAIKDKTANMRAFIGQKWSDLKTKWTAITTNIKDVVAEFKGAIKQKWSDLKGKWEDITNNIKDKVAQMKANVAQKWADIKDKWFALTSNIKDITANIIMKISTTLASVKQFVRDIIIAINDKLNSVKWPSWVPGIGGKNILPYNPIPVPALASGAVIPANKQFLAVLGDQKQGVNIETPLATMIEAFNTALQNAGMMGNADINVYLQGDARQLFKVVRTEARNYTKSTGKAAFNL